MRIYLSGPMTGLPDHNIPAFNAAARRFREQGHFVINPAELSTVFGDADTIGTSFAAMYGGWTSLYQGVDMSKVRPCDISPKIAEAVMDADLAAVRSCDAIYLLKGWEYSRGAKKELAEAIKCGLDVMQEGGAK